MSPSDAQFFLKRVYPALDQVRSRPKNGAGDAFQVLRGDHVVVEAIFGGGMPEGMVNFICSGRDAPEFAQACQALFPNKCRVTRADAAVDFDEEHAWETLYEWGLMFAKDNGLDTDHRGDYLRGEKGRSLYIGARSSATRLVIYEKGKQIPEWMRPNLVRAEFRVMPKGPESKTAVGNIEQAHKLFSCSRWGIKASEFLLGDDLYLTRVNVGTHWLPSDQARAVNALTKQYGAILARLAVQAGGWPELGVLIGEKLLESENMRNQIMLQFTGKVRQSKVAPILQQLSKVDPELVPF